MEPRPGRTPLSTRRRVILGVVLFFLTAIALTLLTFGPARDREVSNLGVDVFDINAQSVAEQIAANGPFFFPDPLNRDRPIWVQHEGSVVDAGWSVFAATSRPGCLVDYDAVADDFVDCDGTRFPSDGEGLVQYPFEIDGSVLSIDVNFAERTGTEPGDGR